MYNKRMQKNLTQKLFTTLILTMLLIIGFIPTTTFADEISTETSTNTSTETSVKTGWTKTNGEWYYINASTKKPHKGWLKSNGKWYYMNKQTGVMHRGWIKSNGKWYFMNKKTGVMCRGWCPTNYRWYYMDKKTGAMHRGWLKSGRNWYYFRKSDGRMLNHDYAKSGNTWYLMRVDGVMRTTCRFKNYVPKDQIDIMKEIRIEDEHEILAMKQIDKILDRIIKPGMTIIEKELAIRNWVMQNLSYGRPVEYYGWGLSSYLKYGKGVCGDYSALFREMCIRAGIRDVRIVHNPARHAWNQIKLNGKWYNVDVTWTDPRCPDDRGWFNVTDSQMKKSDLSGAHSYYKDRGDNTIEFTAALYIATR